MIDRRIRYLTARTSVGPGGEFKIAIDLSPTDEEAPPQDHDCEIKGGEKAIISACETYWEKVANIVGGLEKHPDETTLKNQVIILKSLAIEFTKSIFDQRTMRLIWEAADNCEALLIVTDLVNFPWEALVNPWAADRQFLLQKCAVFRRARINSTREVRKSTEPVAPSEIAIFVDAELDEKWRGANTQKTLPHLFREYAALAASRKRVHICGELDNIFDLIRQMRVVTMICENESDKYGDRLRIAKGLHLTSAVVEAEAIDQDAVLFLFTCGRGSDADKTLQHLLPLPAFIATVHGCTVIAPLMPISEFVGIQLMRKIVTLLIWRYRHLGRHVILLEEIQRLRDGEFFGSPTLAGIMSLFFAIYGRPTAQLS